ncbi:MAG: hypothetical protein ACYCX2_04245 [Christensenellales bacterium]
MFSRRAKMAASLLTLLFLLSNFLCACACSVTDQKDDAGLFGLTGPSPSPESAELIFDTYDTSPFGLKALFDKLELPPLANLDKWKGSNDKEQLLLDASFHGIPLNQLLKFMQSLQAQNWFLTENMAYKGINSLKMSYDVQTRQLDFQFTQDKNKSEWPDVLPPYLAYITPVFPYGIYTGSESRSIEGCESATMLLYKDVTKLDLETYEKILEDAGYVFDKEINGQRFFKKDTLFVTLTLNQPTQEAAIIVGNFRVYLSALPPWPDPLPEDLKRILSPVSAICKASVLPQGYEATAEDLNLAELYSFFKAMSGYYAWSELNDNNEMSNVQKGADLTVVSYNTGQNMLTLHLAIQGGTQPTATMNPTATINPTPTPMSTFRDEGFDDGLPDFNFMLTEGYYSEQEAMDGILQEFGQTVVMASWDEMKALYSDRFSRFLDYVGVKGNEDVWLLYGKSGFDGTRHYFLARISGNPRDNFKLYDKVGDEAWLGSWYGVKLRVMVKAPDPLNPPG